MTRGKATEPPRARHPRPIWMNNYVRRDEGLPRGERKNKTTNKQASKQTNKQKHARERKTTARAATLADECTGTL
eukprot:4293985-Pyramimonas_sp.AAC.1